MRVTYNEGVTKIPGSYNESGQVDVQVVQSQTNFDFLNLTNIARVDAMQKHSDMVEEVLKKQLKVEQFEDFYSPI